MKILFEVSWIILAHAIYQFNYLVQNSHEPLNQTIKDTLQDIHTLMDILHCTAGLETQFWGICTAPKWNSETNDTSFESPCKMLLELGLKLGTASQLGCHTLGIKKKAPLSKP